MHFISKHTIQIMFKILLLNAVQAALNCITLPSNTICGPAFQGFPIANSTVDAFNSNLIREVANSSALAMNLVRDGICIAPSVFKSVQTLRYQVSFQCAYFVGQAVSQGCSVPVGSKQENGPLLCSAQCFLASETVKALATNPSVCPNGKGIDVNSYVDYCNSLSKLLPSNSNICFNGIASESKFCGFSDEATAKTQCSSLKSDSCCKDLLDPPITTSDNNSNSPITTSDNNSNSPINATSATATASSSNENSKKRVIAIVFSVLGGLLFIGMIFALVYFYRRRTQITSSNASSPTAPEFYVKPHPLSQQFKLPQENRVSHTYTKATAENRKSYVKTRPQQQTELNTHQEDSLSAATAENRKSYVKSRSASSFIASGGVGKELVLITELPESSKRMHIIHPYDSDISDELSLAVGKDIFLVTAYDDGWALGVDPYSGERGAFPMVCVKDADEVKRLSTAGTEITSMYSSFLDRNSISNRNSSMIVTETLNSTTPPKVRFTMYLDQLDKFDEENVSQ